MALIIILECVIFIALSCGAVFWSIRPAAGGVLGRMHVYPPVIIARCRELGIVPENGKGPEYNRQRAVFILVSIPLQSCLCFFMGGARDFLNAFLQSYLMWVTELWFEVFILGCGWFCHASRWVIPGTEDLRDVYKDYWYHIKGGILGMSMRTVLAAPVGFLVNLMADLIA